MTEYSLLGELTWVNKPLLCRQLSWTNIWLNVTHLSCSVIAWTQAHVLMKANHTCRNK